MGVRKGGCVGVGIGRLGLTLLAEVELAFVAGCSSPRLHIEGVVEKVTRMSRKGGWLGCDGV